MMTAMKTVKGGGKAVRALELKAQDPKKEAKERGNQITESAITVGQRARWHAIAPIPRTLAI